MSKFDKHIKYGKSGFPLIIKDLEKNMGRLLSDSGI